MHTFLCSEFIWYKQIWSNRSFSIRGAIENCETLPSKAKVIDLYIFAQIKTFVYNILHQYLYQWLQCLFITITIYRTICQTYRAGDILTLVLAGGLFNELILLNIQCEIHSIFLSRYLHDNWNMCKIMLESGT